MTDQTHKCWFHGSPEELSTLRVGSWVTPYREFAKAFSHKPFRVTATGDDVTNVRHDGKMAGFLVIGGASIFLRALLTQVSCRNIPFSREC